MKRDCELSTYAEIVEVVSNLRFLVRERRRREQLSMNQVAEIIGVSPSTIHRFETGKGDVSTDNMLALVRWVGGLPQSPKE